MKNIHTPVLLIVFNRPVYTKLVLEKIKEVAPMKLYIASDGPRENNIEDYEKCNSVREIFNGLDWECNTNYRYNEHNVGCRRNVTEAISWVLEKEDRVIIIEDDVIPAKSFFYFAQDMLDRYLSEEKIAMISACNFTPLKNYQYDYHFSKYGHIWGWATWKRSWDSFNLSIPDMLNLVNEDSFKEIFTSTEEYKFHYRLFLREHNRANAWGYLYYFYRLHNRLLSLVPRVNLASNIGITGEHTTNQSKVHFVKFDEFFTWENHPLNIECDQAYEYFHFSEHLNNKSRKYSRILSRIKRAYKWN